MKRTPRSGSLIALFILVTLSVLLGACSSGSGSHSPLDPAPEQPATVPDPADVAPPVSKTVATSLATATAFLYTSADPIQSGVAEGTIEERRASVLRGKVQDRDGQPLAGVKISVLDHPEFGWTTTRTDGMFDLAVNGGGYLTVNYEAAGHLPAQRKIDAPWQDYAWLPDVALIPLDGRVTPILASAQAMQVARGNPVMDDDGPRQATILFPAGVSAEMTLPDGSKQPLDTLHVRATEYTVGPNGPQAMPGELPPTTAYTYAVELSVDEALAAGATRVDFSQPVPFYVENFLGFPVGGIVPAGYYDRAKAAWIASDNGRVVKILSTHAGIADLDIDGSGQPAGAAALAALGVTEAEVRQLANLYQPGDTLWRVPVPHFTPWDCNWPYGPPEDAEPPQMPGPDGDDDEQDTECGSIIECQSQSLGERIRVAGTPFSLNYKSDRVVGRKASNTLNIPLSGDSLPASLRRIQLQISVAGQQRVLSFPNALNQSYSFEWDGRDAYGRVHIGSQAVKIRIGYVYPAIYLGPQNFERVFGSFGYGALPMGLGRRSLSRAGNVEASRRALEITFWQEYSTEVGAWDATTAGLGAWSLDVHHVYDPHAHVLHQGDGLRRSAANLNRMVISVVAGGGSSVEAMDVPATDARLSSPQGIAVGRDGSVYIADTSNNRIRHVRPGGLITTIAGTGVRGFSGDGGPALDAKLDMPRGIAVGNDGSLYISDSNNHRIRRIGLDGVITTVAGMGSPEYNGDFRNALEATLSFPSDIAVDNENNLYIADFGNYRIRKVAPDGNITTVAGNGSSGYSGNGGLATEASLDDPHAVDIGPDGSLYFVDNYHSVIRRVRPDGVIATVAGSGTLAYYGDDGPATEAAMLWPYGVAVARDGVFYVADSYNHVVREVGQNGVIRTIAGIGDCISSVETGLATSTNICVPWSMAIGPDGNLYIAEYGYDRILRLGTDLTDFGLNEIVLASSDGQQIFRFDKTGRHLATLDAMNGAVIYTFEYGDHGYLVSIADRSGNVTNIERQPDGTPIAIVSPDGLRTTLALDGSGYLAALTNPAGDTHRMEYSEGGLLQRFTDPNGHASIFEYDELGRLVRDENAAGGRWTLERKEISNGHEVSMTTRLGRKTVYRVEKLSTGGQRRTKTAPDGLSETTIIGSDGTRRITEADGTVTQTQEGADERFGMHAPVELSRIITTPQGRVHERLREQSVLLAEPGNPLSLERLTEVTTDNGRIFKTEYDAATRTLTITSAENRQANLELDDKGRVIRSQAGTLAPVTYTYDYRGRPSAILAGEGDSARQTTFGYDDSGYPAGISNALQQTVTFQNDLAGRILRQTLADNRRIDFGYDAKGNITAISPPERSAHRHTYNAIDQEAEYSPPDLGPGAENTRYEYDLDKNLTQTQRPDGKQLQYGYDSAGRLSKVSLARGDITYQYHATTGNLRRIDAPGNLGLSYAYDGKLLLSETWDGAIAGAVTRTNDNNFWLTRLDVAGTPIDHGYDHDGLLTQAGGLTLEYHPQNGLLTATTLESITTAHAYNDFAELEGTTAAYGSNTLYTTTYTRDALGRITAKAETLQGDTHSYQYGYDTTGRLVTVRKDGVTIASYLYDSNGNRTGGFNLRGPITASHDAQDRLTAYNGTGYGYNANGDLATRTASGATTTYGYDELGNLVQATLPGDITLDYLIDGRNRRIGKKVNGALVQGFLYQNQLNPIAELDGQGNIVSRFIYADRINVPSYMIKGGNTYRILSDHLGSPRLIVNVSDGSIVQRMDYDEFGNATRDTNPGFQPFGFAGGLHDQHTGLVRFGARDYDPITGRWTAKDPIGFAGGDGNLYSYVGNNPVNFTDPSGLFLCSLLSNLGDLNIDLSAGVGNGLGVSGSITLSSSGIEGSVTAGSGIGLGASVGASKSVTISPSSGGGGGGIGTSVSVSGGVGGFGGSAEFNSGSGGVKASGSIGFGFGANITAGVNVNGTMLNCEEDDDGKCDK